MGHFSKKNDTWKMMQGSRYHCPRLARLARLAFLRAGQKSARSGLRAGLGRGSQRGEPGGPSARKIFFLEGENWSPRRRFKFIDAGMG